MEDQSPLDLILFVERDFLALFEGVRLVRLQRRLRRLDRLVRNDLLLLLLHVRFRCFGVHGVRFPCATPFHTCLVSSSRSLRPGRTIPAPASRRSCSLLRPVATATSRTPAVVAA